MRSVRSRLRETCILSASLSLAGLAGCTPSYVPPYVPPYLPRDVIQLPPATESMHSGESTRALENEDRIARFRRLAAIAGVIRPVVDEIVLPSGTVPNINGPVPVVRVLFEERAFFNTAEDQPLPEASPLLNLIAENMRRDVPDASLTVLGHTDAIGTDDYNIDLSRRRATTVFAALVQRGMNPFQLSTVAIGKRQPIASNATVEGRSYNRRVEFMISASLDANLAAIQTRQVNISDFATGTSTTPQLAVDNQVQVLRPPPIATLAMDRNMVLSPERVLRLPAPIVDAPVALRAKPVESRMTIPDPTPQAVSPAPATKFDLIPPDELHRQPLGSPTSY